MMGFLSRQLASDRSGYRCVNDVAAAPRACNDGAR